MPVSNVPESADVCRGRRSLPSTAVATMRVLTICMASCCLVARGEQIPEFIENSIGVRMKLLPAGTFTMGDDLSDSFQRPAHRVTLSRPFYLGVHEVTWAQWKRVMDSLPNEREADDHPAESVSWQEVVTFCEKLSALPEERKAGRVYRLPTEAEWEYACRAGTITKFSYGDYQADFGEYGWFEKNASIGHNSPRPATHPVGLKKPNPWGLHDMHGNVAEWCSDAPYRYTAAAVTDPTGRAEESSRIMRGGSWRKRAGYGQSAYRLSGGTWTKSDEIGFRLALSPSESGPPAKP